MACNGLYEGFQQVKVLRSSTPGVLAPLRRVRRPTNWRSALILRCSMHPRVTNLKLMILAVIRMKVRVHLVQ